MSDIRTKRELAIAMLHESLGHAPHPTTSPVKRELQQLADALAGRAPTPKPGSAAAQLAALEASERAGTNAVTRKPSDELRSVIEDVIRGMHARGELGDK